MARTATYGDLKVVGPYEIQTWSELQITKKINGHGSIRLMAQIPVDQQDNYVHVAQARESIEVYELDEEEGVRCLFKGVVTRITIERIGKGYWMNVEGLSYTCLLDKTPKVRAFQNSGMTYSDVVDKVIRGYRGSDCNDQTEGEKIAQFLLQYQETDWEFLVRAASRLGTGLVADATVNVPKFWFGIPRRETTQKLKGIKFTAYRHPMQRKLTVYEVEEDCYLDIGDVVKFQNQPFVVTQSTAAMRKGMLVYNYTLMPEAGLACKTIDNYRLVGASLEGQVIDVKGERVKLQLDRDDEVQKEEAVWFPYLTVYTGGGTIGWHCTPEPGDTVHLYFPNCREEQAVVKHSFRKSPQSARGDMTADPNTKYFSTRTKKQIRFGNQAMVISTNDDAMHIRIDQETGIDVSSQGDLTFAADVDLVLHGHKVRLSAEHEINGDSRTNRFRMDGEQVESHHKASAIRLLPTQEAELKAFEDMADELQKGAYYPSWSRPLLQKFKIAYYQARAEGDAEGMKAAEANAREVYDKRDEIGNMPDWARKQLNDYTSRWYEADAAGKEADKQYYRGLADSLRDKVKYIAMMRECTTESYVDANRMEELSDQYRELKNGPAADSEQTGKQLKSIEEEANKIRDRYGMSDRGARENLNKLAAMYPNDFKYKLKVNDRPYDDELNESLYDFAKQYGLVGTYTSLELLKMHVHQVANGIAPWPKTPEGKKEVKESVQSSDQGKNSSHSPNQGANAGSPPTPGTNTGYLVKDGTFEYHDGKGLPTTETKYKWVGPDPYVGDQASPEQKREALKSFARQFLPTTGANGNVEYKIPYHWETQGWPNDVYDLRLTEGVVPLKLSCDQFTKFVYKNVLRIDLDATSGAQYKQQIGSDIYNKVGNSKPDWSTVKIGDLLFLSGHVAMYQGDGMLIHENGDRRYLPREGYVNEKSCNTDYYNINIIRIKRIVQDSD